MLIYSLSAPIAVVVVGGGCISMLSISPTSRSNVMSACRHRLVIIAVVVNRALLALLTGLVLANLFPYAGILVGNPLPACRKVRALVFDISGCESTLHVHLLQNISVIINL